MSSTTPHPEVQLVIDEVEVPATVSNGGDSICWALEVEQMTAARPATNDNESFFLMITSLSSDNCGRFDG